MAQMPATLELAQRLARAPTRASRLTKRATNRVLTAEPWRMAQED